MKAMCQAVWLLTVAIGNFVVIIIAETSAFEDRVSTCILDSALLISPLEIIALCVLNVAE